VLSTETILTVVVSSNNEDKIKIGQLIKLILAYLLLQVVLAQTAIIKIPIIVVAVLGPSSTSAYTS
jgi:hypothetical protein